MRIIQDISEEEKAELLQQLYESFETGFDFEEFLKPFLETLGLTEVGVTKKTGDDGIDLLGIKPGLDSLDGNDAVQYKVQAKRFKPSTTISPEKIDALRGNLNFNQKGLFITTGHVSNDAKIKAKTKDPSKPVIVIDGMDLVELCIQNQIGCAYKPIFSKEALSDFLNIETKQTEKITETKDKSNCVSKLITANDIRAKIISIPSIIVSKIANNEQKHGIELFVNEKKYTVTFNPSRNYLGSVTGILKEYNLISEDGSFKEKKALWDISDDGQTIYIEL